MSVLLPLAFFVCPLLFFTDLTRNPYFSQIALLNILLVSVAALAAVRAARKQEWRWPRSPLDLPWAAWLAAAGLSWAAAWLRHAPFFRPSVLSEGLRVFEFTVVNTFVPFAAGAALSRGGDEDRPGPGAWLGLAAAFGLAWTLFPALRAPASPDTAASAHLWDAYGGLVWLAGGFAAVRLGRGATLTRLFHVALAAAILASVYGVLQYFNIEWVWPKVLNPYGGRSVSTFGNPNFLSTFVVLFAPAVFLHFLLDDKARWLYGGALVVMWLSLLASLTRSSWAGAAVGAAVLFAWPGVRAAARKRRSAALAMAASLALLACLWPRSPVEGYRATALQRLVEAASSLSSAKPGEVYAPWHQRLLIWTCAWQMGLDSPVVGQGWGQFELFYPFYQGPLLYHTPMYRSLRTHANNSHNEALELFSQTGLLGLGVQVWFWFVFFRLALSTWRGPRQQEEPKLGGDGFWAWGLAAGAAGVLVDNLMNVSMHFAVPAFALWWCVGSAAGRACREPSVLRPPKAAGWALAAAAAALCGWSAWNWYGQWQREAHYFAGFKLVRQGRLEAAAKELREAYDWHGREVNNNYELGNTLARIGRTDDAVWAYREALNSNAGYDEIYFNLATVLGPKLGRWEEAEDAYRTAAWINPLSKEAATGLAGLLLREPEKRFADARDHLSRVVEVFPGEPSFANNLGYLYSLHGEGKAARPYYELALRADPDFELAEKNLRSTLGAAAAKDPLLSALERRRALERRIGEKKIDAESLALAEDAGRTFPEDLKTRFYRGSLRLAMGRPAEGVEDLRWVIARQPANTAARLNLGRALDALGRKDEARVQFLEVQRLEPGNPAIKGLTGG